MALSDDQKAMLRLLAQREQGYEDIAALMGLSVEQVRAKVKDALEQLDRGEAALERPAAEPPAPVKEPAKAVEPPAAVDEPPQAEEPAAVDEPPKPPSPPAPEPPAPAAAAPRPKRAASSPPRLSLPAGKGARAAIAAGVAVVVLVVVVLAVSGGGSGSGSPTTTSSETATGATGEGQTTPTVDGKEVTEAHLVAVDGSGASGTALFGRVKNSLALQVEAAGLEPTVSGQAYTIWLAQTPQKMLPLASTPVSKSGKIKAQFNVPTEVLAYLAAGTFDQLEITQTETPALKASLAKATREKKAPAYTGTAVLRGTIVGPIVGAAKKQKKE